MNEIVNSDSLSEKEKRAKNCLSKCLRICEISTEYSERNEDGQEKTETTNKQGNRSVIWKRMRVIRMKIIGIKYQGRMMITEENTEDETQKVLRVG